MKRLREKRPGVLNDRGPLFRGLNVLRANGRDYFDASAVARAFKDEELRASQEIWEVQRTVYADEIVERATAPLPEVER